MRMYKALTQAAVLGVFGAAKPESGIPVFSDVLGDVAHFALEDSIADAVEISEALEVKEPFAVVVHVEIDDNLMSQLIYKGHLARGGADKYGKETWRMDIHAAATINRVALVTVSYHKLGVLIRNERPAPDRVH